MLKPIDVFIIALIYVSGSNHMHLPLTSAKFNATIGGSNALLSWRYNFARNFMHWVNEMKTLCEPRNFSLRIYVRGITAVLRIFSAKPHPFVRTAGRIFRQFYI